MKKGGAKTLNLGNNDIVGKVSFGEGCIINPSCSIICQDKNKEIVFGDYNIIEQKAIILVKANSKVESNIVKIGSYNIFGIKSYVADCQIGDCNVLEPKVELKQVWLGNGNIVGAEVKITKSRFKDGHRFFYPGKVKIIDSIDLEKQKELIRSTYVAMTEK